MTLTFHTFGRWSAVAVDGVCQGYIEHFHGESRLHLKKDAADWLKDVRKIGPFENITACQKSLLDACLEEDYRNADLSYAAKILG